MGFSAHSSVSFLWPHKPSCESLLHFLLKTVLQEILELCVNSINMHADVLLQFLEDENFAWSLGEATYADLVELVVFEEGLCVDEASAGNVVVFVLELLWHVFRVAEGVLVQLLVDTFVGTLLKHVSTDVNTIDVLESLIVQVLSNQTCSASKIEDFNFSWILFVLLSEFRNLLGYIFRIW